MTEFVTKNEHEDQVSVYFNIEADEVMAIGAQMESLNEEAYMNGYNWEAFLNCYLQANQPALLEGLDTDSEAGTYVAVYAKADAGNADKLVNLINELVHNPEIVYNFLKVKGEDIQWD